MIKWSKNYLMGIDKLDEEHKELFRISDQIYNRVMERGDDAKYRPCMPEPSRSPHG